MAAYGYAGYYKPPKTPRIDTRSLALAAGGGTSPSNPFGFSSGHGSLIDVGNGQTLQPPRAPGAAPPASAPRGLAPPVNTPVSTPAAPPVPHGYDVNTDPALQQANALVGLNDEQAQAEAIKQQKQLLLGYGDPNLAKAVLGEDPTVEAAGQNPFSTLAQLGTERDRNTRDLTEGLNKSNLGYSGWRILQEGQDAHDYQAQLAQAAAGANEGLASISAALAAALASGNTQRAAALLQAYQQHATDPGAAGLTAGASGTGQTAAPWAPTGGDIIDRILQQPGPPRTTASVGSEIPTDPDKLRRLLAQAMGGNKLFAA